MQMGRLRKPHERRKTRKGADPTENACRNQIQKSNLRDRRLAHPGLRYDLVRNIDFVVFVLMASGYLGMGPKRDEGGVDKAMRPLGICEIEPLPNGRRREWPNEVEAISIYFRFGNRLPESRNGATP